MSHAVESQPKGFRVLFMILWDNSQNALQDQVLVQVCFKQFRHCAQSNRVAEDRPAEIVYSRAASRAKLAGVQGSVSSMASTNAGS